MRLAGHVVTHPGKERSNNEDSVALLRRRGIDGQVETVLAIVADGMGGHECGEVASRMAVEAVSAEAFTPNISRPQALRRAFVRANEEILERAEAERNKRGMGTTLVAALVENEQAWFAWVGDSRAYLLRRGKLFRISEDHTAVREMVKQGLLTAEEARHHADRNVLSRAIGTHRQVQVDVTEQPLDLMAGDRILLCSDGLHDLISDEELAEYSEEHDPAFCSERLLAMALERGGHDNISIILLEAVLKAEPVRSTREVPTPC